jgi:hypothetical protein
MTVWYEIRKVVRAIQQFHFPEQNGIFIGNIGLDNL